MDADSALAMIDTMGLDAGLNLEGEQLAGLFGAMEHDQVAGFGSDQLFNVATNMHGEHFQFMDDDSAQAMLDAIGADQALGLGGNTLAGILSAMDGVQIGEYGSGEIFNFADTLTVDDFGLLDSDSAFGVFTGMELDQALNLQGDQLAGLFNVMDGSKIPELGGDTVVELFTNWGPESLGILGSEQALGVATALNGSHFESLEAPQLLGLTTAIDSQDIGELGSEVLSVIAGNLEINDLANLNGDLASGIFGQVTDEAFGAFDPQRVEVALEVLNADFFNAGAADFGALLPGTTIFDQVDFDTPDALQDLIAGQDAGAFFGGLFSSDS